MIVFTRKGSMLLPAWLTAVTLVVFGCGGGASGVEVELSDGGGGTPGPSLTYGGQTYRTVIIGGKTWMAENLNYETSRGSWRYDNKSDSCKKYGRLYDWAAAMNLSLSYNSGKWGGSDVNHRGVCPENWHLPSRTEWRDLAKSAEGTGAYGTGGTAGTKLKSRTGWNSYSDVPAGTDVFGFSALPDGFYGGGGFYGAGSVGIWWTASEIDDIYAYYRLMYYNIERVGEGVRMYGGYRSYGFAVRCVRDGNEMDSVAKHPEM